MNYLILQSIINTMSANFRCQQCGGSIGPQDINLLGTSGKDMSIEITCPQCQANMLIKAEMNQIGTENITDEQKRAFLEMMGHHPGMGSFDPSMTSGLQFSFDSRIAKTHKTSQTVTDADILSVRENLQNKNITVSDLFRDLPSTEGE